ncbi:ImmA/IrrE family metallo-endopeptidase [Castellaniella defragrans]|nr:ImmA/IrrE family metallo-endopeptidase [Castellaniella defragrans]
MFGGLNVDIGAHDARALFDVLIRQHQGHEHEQLNALVSSPSIYEYLQPYAHGYELAYQIRESLRIDPCTAFIDIEQLLTDLGITILETHLETSGIRGVAIAGQDFSPAIVINASHKFNSNSRGRRFTLAHEFCHILFDRSRARRLSHISGPWSSARVEKRANAFAAMFLATPHALEKALSTKDPREASTIKHLANKFEIGTAALLEHLRNLDLISDDDFQTISGYRHHPSSPMR